MNSTLKTKGNRKGGKLKRISIFLTVPSQRTQGRASELLFETASK